MSSNSEQPASLISGHAQYAKGYVEETVGKMTGSNEWKQNGKEHAQQGIEEMKTAGQQRGEPKPSTIMGQVEEMAGTVTGCERMESEGKEKQENYGL